MWVRTDAPEENTNSPATWTSVIPLVHAPYYCRPLPQPANNREASAGVMALARYGPIIACADRSMADLAPAPQPWSSIRRHRAPGDVTSAFQLLDPIGV